MRTVTVQEYNNAERVAMARLPNRLVEAMQACLFAKVGYPFVVSDRDELQKYVDVMHETLFESRFLDMLEGITPSEFDTLNNFIGLVARFTQATFDKVLVPRATLMQSLSMVRHIKYLFGSARPRVFEFGPGCGYLGGLLALDGYPYAATDVAQAFYLYQNHLWSYLTNGNVVDGANSPDAVAAFAKLDGSKIVHLPWWVYSTIPQETMPLVDVVTANHVFAEMHDNSLRLALLNIRMMLRGRPDEKKLLVFEGWGHADEGKRCLLMERFTQFGFKMLHHDLNIAVFVPETSEAAIHSLPFPRIVEGVQHQLVNGQVEAVKTESYSWSPIFYSNPSGPTSRAISEQRAIHAKERTVPIASLVAVYKKLLGTDDLRTGDEKFWHLIGLQAVLRTKDGGYL